ncbi:DUF1127 domain-containing protein [Magnetovibrio sp. PR-2]|uniref:DUF1127 domain-containing protein n=1 Tax=Magnetovibrio sp. PR-2 TaxID=3120356 RepID=UPI002FCDED15
MNRDNCTDTFNGIDFTPALPLTWHSWLDDGKQLMVRELARAVVTLKTWMTRSRSRRHLAGLDAYLLDDIGLTKAQAVRESEKPFWQD